MIKKKTVIATQSEAKGKQSRGAIRDCFVAVAPRNDYCSFAFKEWSVIVQALLDGQQSLILRKGGISENQGRFTIESKEFFLYPTKVHQDPKDLVNVADQEVIAAAQGQITADAVNVKAYAEVAHYERLKDADRIKALRKYHVWSDQIIDQRFHWGNEDWLDLFVLKVFRLPAALTLKNDPKFAGCKSWIRLESPLSAKGAVPVLPEARFQKLLSEILGILKKQTWGSG